MTDRDVAEGLLAQFRAGGALLRRPMKLSPPATEGLAALVDFGSDDAPGRFAPAFWRHGRWETALREPFPSPPPYWSEFAGRD